MNFLQRWSKRPKQELSAFASDEFKDNVAGEGPTSFVEGQGDSGGGGGGEGGGEHLLICASFGVGGDDGSFGWV